MNRLGERIDHYTEGAALAVLEGRSPRRGMIRFLPFIGPAFIAAVAYIDPGNFATNIASGSQFGFSLLWIVIASSLSAYFVQTLAAKLGTVSGRNLAEQCRERYPHNLVLSMWIGMEAVAMATDLAEFIGASIAFHMLFPVSLAVAGGLTALSASIVLAVQAYGFRPFEWVISAFVGFVALAYLIELGIAQPDWIQIGSHFLPGTMSHAALFLAVSIVGATIMPHVIFLHSALTQKRIRVREAEHVRPLLRFQFWDILVAMTLATATNAAMLIMAAIAFHEHGMNDIVDLSQAYRTLTPILGAGAAVLFALALLASGISATTVGTYAGQIIMQGFVNIRIPLWIRRSLTLVPSFVIVAFSDWNLTRVLIWTQVLISFGLPIALIPLMDFTSRRKVMGTFANHPLSCGFGWSLTLLLVVLNVTLIVVMLR
jgi:manganese transport protein